MDMTAAGMLAETVMPAYRPRYAFAAVMRTPNTIPTKTTRNVSSSGDSSAGIYGSPKPLMALPVGTSRYSLRLAQLDFTVW